ncbi:hypothetical protein EIP91_000527 [Steccherinum ochraceum]|uniref:Uncharacterized protein n=1 Tax=Steccherinum ochraceum TaxID=92696 RepID=A0A4R0S1C5_9APHY|nr:hypothetical protein EIP91_000527 [Steccherinum ochraceum]
MGKPAALSCDQQSPLSSKETQITLRLWLFPSRAIQGVPSCLFVHRSTTVRKAKCYDARVADATIVLVDELGAEVKLVSGFVFNKAYAIFGYLKVDQYHVVPITSQDLSSGFEPIVVMLWTLRP